MLPVHSISELVLEVRDLVKSEPFYGEVEFVDYFRRTREGDGRYPPRRFAAIAGGR